jgi:membrane protease YdiL (CAAX protease family)
MPNASAGGWQWWSFWLQIAVAHWPMFGLVLIALRRNGEDFSSIGLDWGWFAKHRARLGAILAVLVAGALAAPTFYYGTNVPTHATVIPLLPVTTAQRLFWIFMSLTAGVVEETIFRGYPFRRLGRVIRNPWLILPITMIAFLFLHGAPRGWFWAANYLQAGAVFGIAFILLKLRRLEWLVLAHFLADAVFVLTP